MSVPNLALIQGLVSSVHDHLLTPAQRSSRNAKRDRRLLATGSLELILRDLPKLGKLHSTSLATGLAFDRTESSLSPNAFSYWEGKDSASVLALRQVLNLFSKLEVGSDTDSSAFADFIVRNEEVGSLQIPYSPEIRYARNLLRRLLAPVDLSEIKPKHGPGAVFHGEKPWDKMQFKRIYRSMDTMYPFCDYFFLNYTHLVDSLSSLESLVEYESPHTKLIAVPKDFRGPRLISVEPLETQWIQQGQLRRLMPWIERHPLTSGHVNFTDQTVNQRLACQASLDMQSCTVDLKDASDRVSFRLVEMLLGGLPLWPYLKASRSTSTRLPCGQMIELNMFAPMGSAVCFPVEALVFWALCVSACVCRSGIPEKEALQGTYVYGDDLIVPTRCVGHVCAVLESAGLKVNTQKTCVGPSFRESCGTDWWDGVLVTPVRLKSLPDRRAPASYASAIAHVSELRRRQFEKAAALLESALTTEFGAPPRSHRDSSYAVYCGSDEEAFEYNSRVFPRRFNKSYQCWEWKVPCLVPVFRQSNEPVWSMVFRNLMCGPMTEAGMHAVPHRVRLQTRWLAL